MFQASVISYSSSKLVLFGAVDNSTDSAENTLKRVALFGYGYWGSRLARAIHTNKRTRLTHIIDPLVTAANHAQLGHPTAQCEQRIRAHLEREIDLVVIATKPAQHFEVATWALENCLPTIVAKPLTLDVGEESSLNELASRTGTPLFVDFTYLYSSEVQIMKQLIGDGRIGIPKRLISLRTNLGIVQSDHDVLWDLAVHDLSIIDYLFEPSSVSVSVAGTKDSLSNQLSTATINLLTHGDLEIFCTISVSWFSARKTRLIVVDGSEGTLQFDDTKQSDKLQLTDGQVEITFPSEDQEVRRITSYTIGQTQSIKVDNTETLQREFDQILDALSGLSIPRNNPSVLTAQIAVRVSTIVRACQSSLRSDGKTITVVLP